MFQRSVRSCRGDLLFVCSLGYLLSQNIFLSFFCNDSATTDIYTYCHTLSLHDALPFSQDHLARRPITITAPAPPQSTSGRSEEHTSELQSLMRTSYAVFCLKKKKKSELFKTDWRTKNQYKLTDEAQITEDI